MNTPLVRLLDKFCQVRKDLGSAYFERNDRRINIANLGPNVACATRLREVCAIAKILRLKPNECHDVASHEFYGGEPRKYHVTIEGGGPEILELIIGLAARQAEVTIA